MIRSAPVTNRSYAHSRNSSSITHVVVVVVVVVVGVVTVVVLVVVKAVAPIGAGVAHASPPPLKYIPKRNNNFK